MNKLIEKIINLPQAYAGCLCGMLITTCNWHDTCNHTVVVVGGLVAATVRVARVVPVYAAVVTVFVVFCSKKQGFRLCTFA